MSSGKTHAKVTKILAPVTGIAVFAITGSPVPAVLTFVGCLLSLAIEPDLDVDNSRWRRTNSEARMVRRFGILGHVWYAYWTPYGRLVKHRSRISHGLIVGTAIRWLYVGWPILLLSWYFGMLTLLQELSPYIIWVFVGNAIADAGHILMDSKLVRFFRKLGR